MNEKVREVIAAYDAAHPHWREEAREREVKEAEERAQRAQQAREARQRAEQQQASNNSEQWWALIDQRIRQHLENEKQNWIEIGGQVISDMRFERRKEIKQAVEEIRNAFVKQLAELEQRLKSVPGKLPPVKVWRPETVVYEGEIASYEGTLYQARKDTAQSDAVGWAK
jgi:hypothetical protein